MEFDTLTIPKHLYVGHITDWACEVGCTNGHNLSANCLYFLDPEAHVSVTDLCYLFTLFHYLVNKIKEAIIGTGWGRRKKPIPSIDRKENVGWGDTSSTPIHESEEKGSLSTTSHIYKHIEGKLDISTKIRLSLPPKITLNHRR